MTQKYRKLFFAGSFNPFTRGHADIVERLLALADSVIVGVGFNIDKAMSQEAAEKNASMIREWVVASGLAEQVEVEVYSGLTAEEAKKRGVCCLARGVRNATDFDYEYSLASLNREAFGIDTILLPASPALGVISSTAVRDLEAHGRSDIAKEFLP